MGEVYRARDERLERSVAIKVLPTPGSAAAEHRERFRREALALSRLSHPNVCAVYDVGTQNGIDYLVMELLDGETLDERLGRGPLTVGAALDVALPILSALEKTHRMGIAHRDLKPSNIMLTRSGVKLLDFGLARFALGRGEPSSLTMSNALTTQGAVLGTLQYMSPEALEGREADVRSDLFSFGAVLYEMITGRRAFRGDTPASVIGAILKEDPLSIVDADASAPEELDRIIRSCLAKDPDERWQDAHDLRLELQWTAEILARPRDRAASRLSRVPASTAVAVLILLAALWGVREFRRVPIQQPAVRFLLDAPAGSQFISVGTHAGPPVLSADGQRLAFVASSPEGRTVLWVRSLGSLQALPLAGTEGATFPFWSPDGDHLGFFADRKLKKVSLAGGAVTTLCETAVGAGGAWSRDNIIVFARDLHGALYRVSAEGGTPAPATVLNRDRQEANHRWPMFLRDGRRFLYAVGKHAKAGRWMIYLGSLDSDRADAVLEADSNALYASGHLIFARSGRLVAQPFDERSLRLGGEAVPIADNVLQDAVLGRAVFSVSESGTLVYQTGAAVTGSRLTWVDRSGTQLGTLGEPGFYIWPRLSPDGQRVAVSVTDPHSGNADIWIYEIGDAASLQLTFNEAQEGDPTWTHDGNRVFFTSFRRGIGDIYWTDANGREAEETFFESKNNKFLSSASTDGRWLVFSQQKGAGPAGTDVSVLPLTGERQPKRLSPSEHNTLFGEISPDGRWLLYQSNESGKMEVYVTAFPPGAWKRRVSQNGGILPRWSADGREVFYLSQDHTTLFAATVSDTATQFRVTMVRGLFSLPMVAGRGFTYDVTRDGQRFLVVVSSGAAISPLTLVLNWDADFHR
jgi:Tol biopolymer transport system component